MIEDYDLGQIIGKGGFAHVFRGRHRSSGLCCAVKVARHVNDKIFYNLQQEIRIHAQCTHPHIAKLICHFSDRANSYLVLEYASLGNLYQLVAGSRFIDCALSERAFLHIFRHVVSAVDYLHTNKIVHRDLKLSNVLLFPNSEVTHNHESIDELVLTCDMKLCDFGLAVMLNHPDEEHFTLCGTPKYMPPEVTEGGTGHSFPADIYSMGCLFYNVVTRMQSISQESVEELYSKHTLDLLKKMTQKSPDRRPSASELMNSINFSNFIFKQIEPQQQISFCSGTTTQSLMTPEIKNLAQESCKTVSATTRDLYRSTMLPPTYSEEPSISSSCSSKTSSCLSEYRESINKLRRSSSAKRSQSIEVANMHQQDREIYKSPRISLLSSERISTSTLFSNLRPFLYVSCDDLLAMNGDSLIFIDSTSFYCPIKAIVDKSSPKHIFVSQLTHVELQEYRQLTTDCSVPSDPTNFHNTQVKPSLDILSDTNVLKKWNIFSNTKSERFVHEKMTSSTVGRVFNKINELVSALKSRIPILVMYLSLARSPDNCNHESSFNCKCILMSNLPLPHFSIQFKDKTVLRYESASGNLSIDYFKSEKPCRWEGNIAARSDVWTDTDGLPSHLKKYLAIAQFALATCLSKEKEHSAKNYQNFNIPILTHKINF